MKVSKDRERRGLGVWLKRVRSKKRFGILRGEKSGIEKVLEK